MLHVPGDEQEIHKIVQTQRRTIERLNKEQVILENKISALKKKVEEVSLQAKKKNKEIKSLVQQKLAQNKNQNDSEKCQLASELATLRKELQDVQSQLIERGTKVSQLSLENDGLKK
jgi:predicted  nucleic acid-binding Zn-ribbon protein